LEAKKREKRAKKNRKDAYFKKERGKSFNPLREEDKLGLRCTPDHLLSYFFLSRPEKGNC